MAVVYDVGLIVLDNVAHLFAGNENIRNEVAAFLALTTRLALRRSGAVLLIGHPNKAGAEFSGSTAWENQVRSRIYLARGEDDAASAFDPDARVLTNSKPNYAQQGQEVRFRWHEWAFVRDDDLPDDQRAEMAANARAAGDNLLFLACLTVRNQQQRPVSERPTSRTYAPREFAKMPESKGIGAGRMEAAMDRLFRNRQIERGFLFRDAAEGKDRDGLRRASPASADLSADLPLTRSADLRSALPPTSAHTLPYTTYNGRGPSGSAAPNGEVR
jgi:RecA-family ATPase